MTSFDASNREHLLELMSERAVYGLDQRGHEELEQEAAAHPEMDTDSLDRAAAAAQLAMLDDVEPLPESLRRRIEASARGFLAAAAPAPGPRLVQTAPAPPRGTLLGWSGWLAAAAVLVTFLVLRPTLTGEFAPQEGRTRLLAQASDLVQVDWSSTEDALGQGVSGDVVWSSDRTEGYMTFRNLTANDPTQNQYQLWIFDGNRPEEHPVDGGVFDVPAGADEVVVPIVAKLDVDQPTLFAVTLERPGGVVVSERDRLLLVAPVN